MRAPKASLRPQVTAWRDGVWQTWQGIVIYLEHPAASRRYETTKAGDAVRALRASLRPQATARRDGVWQTLAGYRDIS